MVSKAMADIIEDTNKKIKKAFAGTSVRDVGAKVADAGNLYINGVSAEQYNLHLYLGRIEKLLKEIRDAVDKA